MEIEAKFIVPDAPAARRLRALNMIADYKLTDPHTLKMRDTFFDIPSGALDAIRYVLRVRRRSDGKTLITLKTPTEKHGAVHRRPEIERAVQWTRTPNAIAMAQLPKPIADALHEQSIRETLAPRFSITQTRHIRAVRDGRRIIGEWSIDRVELRAGGRTQIMYELEVELKNAGTEKQLDEIVATIQDTLQLQAQTSSKFQRARDFFTRSK